MELYQLKAFLTVAKEGNLSRAADRLCLSSPAVSAQVKALEEELGVLLFHRTPKGMTVTDVGKRLLLEAEAAVAATQRMARAARHERLDVIVS